MATLAERLASFAQEAALDVKALFQRAVPPGGTTGQVLAKVSPTNYDTTWQTPSGGGGGMTAAQAYAQNILGLQ